KKGTATVTSKKRGRQAQDSAAEMSNEEEDEIVEPPKKRGRPAKAQAAQDNEVSDEGEAQEPAPTPVKRDVSSSGKQYWLMKAEQEDRDETAKSGRVVNTKFTIDDLRSKTAPELWDGVRNATAAKNMRAMKVGDLAFFYASGGKQGRKPGIVGIMEIVKAAEIDQTVYDENSLGYVEKEKDRGRWVAVQVEYRSKLTKPVYLSELQKYKGGSGVLSNMQELTAARLSVSKVSEEEWNFITEK
ncbi:uncharacterized protein MYCGRDRAFT_26867, partial [Zymoseptoria tritici IPO323]